MNLIAKSLLALGAFAPAGLGCDSGPPRATGLVTVALAAETCVDYCVDALRATLFHEGDLDLPLGPALLVGCGEELSFPALPAGERVLVAVQAFDVTGELRLQGSSAALTVVADGVADATVVLSAIEPATAVAVTPDPVVALAAPAVVTLRGGFGEALGRFGVELGGSFYSGAALDWRADAIDLTLPAGARGGALTVRSCGVVRATGALRVIGAAPGEAAVTPMPGCAHAAAATLLDEGLLVAWACETGGVLTRYALDDDLCPLDPGASWPLALPPLALALHGGSAWVGGPGGIEQVDIAGSAGVALVNGDVVVDLAATDDTIYAIGVDVTGQLKLMRFEGGGLVPVAGIDRDLIPKALATSATRAYVAAHTELGEGRLVRVNADGGVATLSLVQAAAACPGPLAIGVSPSEGGVALACADGGIALAPSDLASFTWIATEGRIDGLAFDGDDLLVAAGSGTLALIAHSAGTVLASFARAPRPEERPALVLSLPGQRVLAAGAEPLTVLTPFDGAGPCAPSGEEVP